MHGAEAAPAPPVHHEHGQALDQAHGTRPGRRHPSGDRPDGSPAPNGTRSTGTGPNETGPDGRPRRRSGRHDPHVHRRHDPHHCGWGHHSDSDRHSGQLHRSVTVHRIGRGHQYGPHSRSDRRRPNARHRRDPFQSRSRSDRIGSKRSCQQSSHTPGGNSRIEHATRARRRADSRRRRRCVRGQKCHERKPEGFRS